jgi:hypothetical protein
LSYNDLEARLNKLMPSNTKQALLITWAVMATVAAVVFAIAAIWLFMVRARDRANLQNRVVTQAGAPVLRDRAERSPPPERGASPGFANVKEADVPGRYRFWQGGEELGTITLNADHTFINKGGTTFKQYHWEISADGLWLQWQRFRSRFSIMEKPGVYVAPSPNGRDQRLEKIE